MATVSPPEYTRHDFSILDSHVQNELERTRHLHRYDSSLVWWMRAKAFGIALLAIGVLAILLAFAFKIYRDAIVERDIDAAARERIQVVETRSRNEIKKLTMEKEALEQSNDAGSNAEIQRLRGKTDSLEESLRIAQLGNARERVGELETPGSENRMFLISQFDTIPFNRSGIEGVIVGKEYADNTKNLPTKQWCYVTKLMPGEDSERKLTLATKENGVVEEGNMTSKAERELKVPTGTLREARKKCRWQLTR